MFAEGGLISSTVKQFGRIEDYLERDYHDVYQIFEDLAKLGSLSLRRNNPGKTFIIPSEELTKKLRNLIDKDIDYETSSAILDSLIIDDYLPTGESFNQPSGVVNRLHKKLPVKSVKGNVVELEGGGKLTKADDFVPMRDKPMSVWVLTGKYDYDSMPTSEYKSSKKGGKNRKRGGCDMPTSGGHYQVKEKDPAVTKRNVYLDTVRCYINFLLGKCDHNPFVTRAASLVVFIQENRVSIAKVIGVDPVLLLHCVKSYSPEAMLLNILEPGRENGHHPILPDCHLDAWVCRMDIVDKPVNVLIGLVNSTPNIDSMISSDASRKELDNTRVKICRDIIEKFSIANGVEELKNNVLQFENSDKIFGKANVEPRDAHNYLYKSDFSDSERQVLNQSELNSARKLRMRKAYFDETVYSCGLTVQKIENDIKLSENAPDLRSVHINELVDFFTRQFDRARLSYERGCKLFSGELWKLGDIRHVELYTSIPLSFLRTYMYLYEAAPKEIFDNRVEDGSNKPTSMMNLEKLMYDRLVVSPNPPAHLRPECAAQVALVEKYTGRSHSGGGI